MKELKLRDFPYIDGYKEVMETYRYEYNCIIIEVPKGFTFDGASIPKVLRWKFKPFDPRWIIAACLHDWTYYKKLMPREHCDKMLRKVMLKTCKPKRYAYEFYYGVRLFGGSHY